LHSSRHESSDMLDLTLGVVGMAIQGMTDELLKDVLAENLTPSKSIQTPERLFGRSKNLTAIDRALSSPGRQIFIYGDRGVGKTSLALTAAHLHTDSDLAPIQVMCGRYSTFAEVIQAVGNATVPVEKRMAEKSSGGGFNFNLPGGVGGVGYTKPTRTGGAITAPASLNDALDIVRLVASKANGKQVIVVDEMERIESPDEKDKFAEFIKNIPELSDNIRFIFCGIGHDLTELLQAHASAGRILETIKLERLHHSDLWQIITAAADKLNVAVQRDALIRIGQISDGFPHYVHLIGESLFWKMFDDPEVVSVSDASHFKAGIEGALQRTEAILRAQYEKATQKTRNTADYEESLWALADSTSDRRQISEVYETSYSRILAKRGRVRLARDTLNQRYLSLRKESHGRIVVGFGSGWFAFRENIMRGYVRLRAEHEGIDLGRHNVTTEL
jgi:Cdc6-like AAA superfamily ATPase